MSKKRKLILAAAVFSAALFAASCGGGGGSTAGTGGGSGGNGSSGGSGGGGGGGGGGGTQPPPASVEGKVLALLSTGVATAGAVNPVAVCELKSDNKAYCGNDLNPSENSNIGYLHEFPNGNVVLVGSGNVLYFYNAQNNTLTKLTNFRALDGTSGTVATGITIPADSRFYATANFLFIYNGVFPATPGDLVAISNTGNVIRDNNVLIRTDDKLNTHVACERVTKGPTVYSLDASGTATPTGPIPEMRAQAGGRFLITLGTSIYLATDRCSVGGILVDNVANIQDAQMVRLGDDFFIAVRFDVGGGDHQVNYYRVSTITNQVTHLRSNNNSNNSAPVNIRDNSRFYYALAGNGFLFVVSGANNTQVGVYDTNGNQVGGADLQLVAGQNVNGLLPFTDRVLARVANNTVHQVDSTRTAAAPTGVAFDVLERCTHDPRTRDISGRGTSFIRCVFDDGGAGGERFSVIAHNGGNSYAGSATQINSTSGGGANITRDNVRFGASAVLSLSRDNTGARGPINLCTITPNLPTSITLSCSTTDIPNPLVTDPVAPGNIPLGDTTRVYPFTNLLKFHGNNVFYLSGTSVRLRDLFSTTALSLPIAVAGASGGNASVDLTKFAFSFTPSAIVPCATQIAYLSSTTASGNIYTLSAANTCVTRILKTFP
jgi:hypothetical protein